ncbi:MAG TPA: hypothetical protein VH274_03195 [Mycobacteriales bacterium]|nr:hypothetical protein [Mycobacteriales bacterium]
MLRTRGASCLALAALAAVLSGCGGSGGTPQAAPSSSYVPPPSPTAPPPCPTPGVSKKTKWPLQVPADLPKPQNASIQDQTTASDGVHIVKFSTPTSLRESVLFVVNKLPKAGYVLGRGDAEAAEADAPFIHGNIRGLVRMLEVAPCQTLWLLATVDTTAASGSSPLLTPHTPSGSPSPLPFG